MYFYTKKQGAFWAPCRTIWDNAADRSLLDVGDSDQVAGGGLDAVLAGVVHDDLAGSDLLLDRLVLLHGEGAEVPAALGGGQADVEIGRASCRERV